MIAHLRPALMCLIIFTVITGVVYPLVVTGIAQVIFRFAMQIGMVPLTGTTNPEHMVHDLQSEKFTLTPEDVRTIETIAV